MNRTTMPNPFNQSDHEDAARERILVKPHTLNPTVKPVGRIHSTSLSVQAIKDRTGLPTNDCAACYHAMLDFIAETLVSG